MLGHFQSELILGQF